MRSGRTAVFCPLCRLFYAGAPENFVYNWVSGRVRPKAAQSGNAETIKIAYPGGSRMHTKKAIRALAVTGTALALLLAASAQAQDRKSIRWATSSVDSYGYKVAAAMVKIAEEALGGEYTDHRQSLSGDHGGDESRDGWQWRDRLHGRCRHDAALCAAKAASRTTRRPRASWSTPGTPIPWNPSWRCRPTRPRNSNA